MRDLNSFIKLNLIEYYIDLFFKEATPLQDVIYFHLIQIIHLYSS